MNPHYHPLYDQATTLQNKFHAVAGGSNDPSAVRIRQQMHNLEFEMAHQRNPHLIENHMHAIQMQMQQAQNGSSKFIQPDLARQFNHHYDNMRRQLRKTYYY